MAIDRNEAFARSEFEAALEIIADRSKQNHYELLRSHTDAWKAVWAQGLIEVDGNLQVRRTVGGVVLFGAKTHTHARTHARTHASTHARTHASTHAHTHTHRHTRRWYLLLLLGSKIVHAWGRCLTGGGLSQQHVSGRKLAWRDIVNSVGHLLKHEYTHGWMNESTDW